jgi:hypothetical protein
MAYEEDDAYSLAKPHFEFMSMMCRGGMIVGTEARHAACPGRLGTFKLLGEDEFKCKCPCHQTVKPKLPMSMNAEVAGELIESGLG